MQVTILDYTTAGDAVPDYRTHGQSTPEADGGRSIDVDSTQRSKPFGSADCKRL